MPAASIVVEFLAKTGSFQTDTARAEKQLKQFKKEAADAGKVIGVAFAGATATIAALMKNTINLADEMLKTAQKVGVSVEALSGLSYAAELSGVEIEGLEQGLKKMSTSIYDAGKGMKEQADAFKVLGISVIDSTGQLKETDKVLLELAERFSKMPDGTEKTALAMKVLGKSGADLIPLLNSGADGIKELTAEAERMGIVIDTQTAKAAERFNDEVTRLEKTIGGLTLQLSSAMLPVLNEMATAMVDSTKATNDLTEVKVRTWADDAAYGFAFMADAALAAKATFGQFGKSLAVVFNDIKTFAQLGTYLANPITAFMNRDEIARLVREQQAFTKAANEDLQGYLNGNYTRFRQPEQEHGRRGESAATHHQQHADTFRKHQGPQGWQRHTRHC